MKIRGRGKRPREGREGRGEEEEHLTGVRQQSEATGGRRQRRALGRGGKTDGERNRVRGIKKIK